MGLALTATPSIADDRARRLDDRLVVYLTDLDGDPPLDVVSTKQVPVCGSRFGHATMTWQTELGPSGEEAVCGHPTNTDSSSPRACCFSGLHQTLCGDSVGDSALNDA